MKKVFFIFILAAFTKCKAQEIEKPKIEFRGVWIATVVNIDWPKKPEDDNVKKQSDFISILDHYKKMNFNAVVVQIRTAGDAFYPSELAPISKYLTGKEGLVPNDNLDFLKWMIIESHNRGFEFHAWLNPYRATFDLNTEILSPKHDYFIHNDWMIKYGTKFYYNPGLPEVQTHLTKVIEEVVKNYDIDAIHFDDLYADNKVWTKNKWIDYIVPQLYWSLENKRASHRKLIGWWNDNVDGVNLYIGNGTYKIRDDKDKAYKDKTEIPKQIDLSRTTKNVKGNIFFSAISLINKNNDVVNLITKQYEQLALPPSSPFFEKNSPEIPIFSFLKKVANTFKKL